MYSWTGSINTTGASLALSAGGVSAQVRPSNALLIVYTANNNTNFWAVTGPATVGSGNTTKSATSQSGDAVTFGISNFTGRDLALSQNYVSGTTFSGSSSTLNETFSSMGLNVGTYVWTMTGSNDTVTLSVIPEPSTTVLAGLACGLGLFRRRRA